MKVDKPSIEDLSKLKFKKVKSYKVLFSYDDREYLLISDSDDDNVIRLFERVKVRDNRYVLYHIASSITCKSASDLIRDISVKRPDNINYCNIDREYFVKALAEEKFIRGTYKEEYDKLMNKLDDIEAEIAKLKAQVSELYADWRKPSGHGSKQYTMEIKSKVAERISGAKAGEWCEEYQAEYGSIHPEYGGVLTDLFSLPVGTTFFCTNGYWSGMIGCNNRGNKTVINDVCERELDKDNHSLYIQ